MEEKIEGLSLFFPAFNEAGNIKRTIEKALPVLENISKDYEVIVVDDGSIDGTDTIIKELMKENSKIRLIRHKKNQGYGAALNTGFKNAKYDLIVYNDGDGQFDFSQIKKFLEKIKDNDLVIGYRKKRVDSILRIFIQFLFKIWVLIFFGISFKDIDCGFKLFKKETLKKIMPLKSNGAMISTEILSKAKKVGLLISEVSVSHYPRLQGKPTGANPKVIFRALKETFDLKFKKD